VLVLADDTTVVGGLDTTATGIVDLVDATGVVRARPALPRRVTHVVATSTRLFALARNGATETRFSMPLGAIDAAWQATGAGGPTDRPTADPPVPSTPDPGALVDLPLSSTVGVPLDELPASARKRPASSLLAEPTMFWESRVRRQIGSSSYRLTYRNLYFESEVGFVVNPDDFLCEGTLRRDEDGTPLFEPAERFFSEDGRPENRFQCDFFPEHTADNAVSVDVQLPDEGGMVSEPCSRFLVGEKRNCDFERAGDPLECTPGATVTLGRTGVDDRPAAVRVCEASHVVGGMPCVFEDALATAVQTATPSTVSFTCLAAREGVETGGPYSVFVAPMVPDDDTGSVTCGVVP
jgi:hypothetical protein